MNPHCRRCIIIIRKASNVHYPNLLNTSTFGHGKCLFCRRNDTGFLKG